MRLPTLTELIVSLSFLLPARRRPVAGPRPRRARPSLEPLEDRAVPSANLGWAFAIGGSGGALVTGVATDSAGDVYIVGHLVPGSAVNFDPNPNDAPVTLTPGGPYGTGFLAKYTASEQLLWVERITPPAPATDERPDYFLVDGAGNLFIEGECRGGGTYFCGTSKYDPNGNMLWTTNLTQAVGNGGAIALDSSGNVYVAGAIYTSTLVSKTTFVAKLSGTNGTVAWDVNYGPSIAPTLAVDGTGNVYVTGWYSGTVNFNPGTGVYSLTSYGSKKTGYVSDAYILKLNSSGGFLWAGSIGTDGGTHGRGVAVDNSGNVFLTGTYSAASKQSDFNPGSGVYALSGSGAYLVKLDGNGNFQWAKGIQGVAGSDTGGPPLRVAVDGSGNVYITSNTSSQTYVEKLDSAGNVVWTVTTDRALPSLCLAVDSLGNVYVAGGFRSTTNFDPNGTYDLSPITAGVLSGFVWKLTQS